MSAPRGEPISSHQDAVAFGSQWEARSVLLETDRLRRLRALTEAEAADQFRRLLQAPPGPVRPSSGLVEQQRVFARLRTAGS